MRWVDGVTESMNMSLSELRELMGQRSLAFCRSWGCKESDTTEEQLVTWWQHVVMSFPPPLSELVGTQGG